jgi:hypothetical protein
MEDDMDKEIQYKSDFHRFINEKYLAWEHNMVGGRGSVSGFAEAIGAHQGDVSHWLRGSRMPGEKVAKKIAASPLIGSQVLTILGYGYRVDDPLLIRTLENLETLPLPVQERFAEMAEQMAEKARTGQTNFSFQPA